MIVQKKKRNGATHSFSNWDVEHSCKNQIWKTSDSATSPVSVWNSQILINLASHRWIKPGLTSKLSINQMGWFFFSLFFYNLFMLGYFFIQPPYKWDPIYQLAISPDRLLLRILLLWSGLSRSPSLEMTKQ